jgi:hypothetical protein
MTKFADTWTSFWRYFRYFFNELSMIESHFPQEFDFSDATIVSNENTMRSTLRLKGLESQNFCKLITAKRSM